MKIHHCHRIIAQSVLLTLLTLSGVTALHAQSANENERTRYRLKERDGLIRDTIATANEYPLDRPYSRFTAKEKASLRSEYEDMPESDEPPFPVDGLASIIEDVSTLIARLRVEGEVLIHVTVSPEGKATSVALLKYPDLETAKAIAYVLVKTRYKPALCHGSPCKMDWAFHTTFHR
jgi:hypothetical protein